MKSVLRIALNPSPEQAQRLAALQDMFALACNAIAPMVQSTRCWNRVALHHMAYKSLREQFPDLGSQMACNVIYSVSRASRLIYQHPKSPFNLAQLGERPLPLLKFDPSCPVYFDRHTLSLKEGVLSLYTLDGRMRFQLNLQPADEQAFQSSKLREIVLKRNVSKAFELVFHLADAGDVQTATQTQEDAGELPQYVVVEESP